MQIRIANCDGVLVAVVRKKSVCDSLEKTVLLILISSRAYPNHSFKDNPFLHHHGFLDHWWSFSLPGTHRQFLKF